MEKLERSNDAKDLRRQFHQWAKNIALICSGSSTLYSVFDNYPLGYQSVDDESNRALYQLIYAYCGSRIESIESMSDGTTALEHLQVLCAQVTSTDAARIENRFHTCKRFNREDASNYLYRLKLRLAEIRRLGKKDLQFTDESALVDKALRGIGTHPLYDSHIRSFETERRQEERLKTPASERLTLDVLERHFISLDEDAAHSNRGSRRPRMAMQTSLQRQRGVVNDHPSSSDQRRSHGGRHGRGRGKGRSGNGGRGGRGGRGRGRSRRNTENQQRSRGSNRGATCYKCHEKGHYADKCPQRDTKSKDTCFVCKQGHNGWGCPDRKRSEQANAATNGHHREEIHMAIAREDNEVYETSVPFSDDSPAIVMYELGDRVRIDGDRRSFLNGATGFILGPMKQQSRKHPVQLDTPIFGRHIINVEWWNLRLIQGNQPSVGTGTVLSTNKHLLEHPENAICIHYKNISPPSHLSHPCSHQSSHSQGNTDGTDPSDQDYGEGGSSENRLGSNTNNAQDTTPSSSPSGTGEPPDTTNDSSDHTDENQDANGNDSGDSDDDENEDGINSCTTPIPYRCKVRIVRVNGHDLRQPRNVNPMSTRVPLDPSDDSLNKELGYVLQRSNWIGSQLYRVYFEHLDYEDDPQPCRWIHRDFLEVIPDTQHQHPRIVLRNEDATCPTKCSAELCHNTAVDIFPRFCTQCALARDGHNFIAFMHQHHRMLEHQVPPEFTNYNGWGRCKTIEELRPTVRKRPRTSSDDSLDFSPCSECTEKSNQKSFGPTGMCHECIRKSVFDAKGIPPQYRAFAPLDLPSELRDDPVVLLRWNAHVPLLLEQDNGYMTPLWPFFLKDELAVVIRRRREDDDLPRLGPRPIMRDTNKFSTVSTEDDYVLSINAFNKRYETVIANRSFFYHPDTPPPLPSDDSSDDHPSTPPEEEEQDDPPPDQVQQSDDAQVDSGEPASASSSFIAEGMMEDPTRFYCDFCERHYSTSAAAYQCEHNCKGLPCIHFKFRMGEWPSFRPQRFKGDQVLIFGATDELDCLNGQTGEIISRLNEVTQSHLVLLDEPIRLRGTTEDSRIFRVKSYHLVQLWGINGDVNLNHPNEIDNWDTEHLRLMSMRRPTEFDVNDRVQITTEDGTTVKGHIDSPLMLYADGENSNDDGTYWVRLDHGKYSMKMAGSMSVDQYWDAWQGHWAEAKKYQGDRWIGDFVISVSVPPSSIQLIPPIDTIVTRTSIDQDDNDVDGDSPPDASNDNSNDQHPAEGNMNHNDNEHGDDAINAESNETTGSNFAVMAPDGVGDDDPTSSSSSSNDSSEDDGSYHSDMSEGSSGFTEFARQYLPNEPYHHIQERLRQIENGDRQESSVLVYAQNFKFQRIENSPHCPYCHGDHHYMNCLPYQSLNSAPIMSGERVKIVDVDFSAALDVHRPTHYGKFGLVLSDTDGTNKVYSVEIEGIEGYHEFPRPCLSTAGRHGQFYEPSFSLASRRCTGDSDIQIYEFVQLCNFEDSNWMYNDQIGIIVHQYSTVSQTYGVLLISNDDKSNGVYGISPFNIIRANSNGDPSFQASDLEVLTCINYSRYKLIHDTIVCNQCQASAGFHHHSQCPQLITLREAPLVSGSSVKVIDRSMEDDSNQYFGEVGMVWKDSSTDNPHSVWSTNEAYHICFRDVTLPKVILRRNLSSQDTNGSYYDGRDDGSRFIVHEGDLSFRNRERVILHGFREDGPLARYNGSRALIEHEYSPVFRRCGIILLYADEPDASTIFAIKPINLRRPTPEENESFRTIRRIRSGHKGRRGDSGSSNSEANDSSNDSANNTSTDNNDDASTSTPNQGMAPPSLQPRSTSKSTEYALMAQHRDTKAGRKRINPRSLPSSPSDFRNWLPDSGASSHFTPFASDLFDVEKVLVPITVADGTTVNATLRGKVKIIFPLDQHGEPYSLTLSRVYFVSGLNYRLFSFQAFLENHRYSVHCSRRFYQLQFDRDATFTIPASTMPMASDSAMASRRQLKTDKPSSLPRINLEKAHHRFGHRALRSLLSGSFHRVWSDYRIEASSDDYCEGCRIAVSRSAARSQRGTPTPSRAFERIFIDIIPAPSNQGLTRNTAFPCFLLVVDHFSRWSWIEGMTDNSSAEVTRCLREYFVTTRSLGRTKNIDFLRGDADSSFLSAEFQSFAIDSNIDASFAAPKHQEMNSICESTWKTIDTMARTMRVHARLGTTSSVTPSNMHPTYSIDYHPEISWTPTAIQPRPIS